MKTLQPGRIVTVYLSQYKYVLALILNITLKIPQPLVTVLLLCNLGDEDELSAQRLVDVTEQKMKGVHIFHEFKELFLPDPPLQHAVVKMSGILLINITENLIKIDPLKIINDYNKRQIPRFQ